MAPVLDVYMHFVEAGDSYLGRIMDGLDPSKSEFAVLPPHFKVIDPLSNEIIGQAMEMKFGSILCTHSNAPNNPTSILLQCLASIIYHSEDLIKIMISNPLHDFNKISILNNKDLLSKLKELVTIEKIPGVIETPSGIPPHIEVAVMMQKVMNKSYEILSSIQNQTTVSIQAAKDAIEAKSWDSGHITGDRLNQMLESFVKNY